MAEGNSDCDICHSKLKDPKKSACGHLFCGFHFESSNAGGITGRVCPIDCKGLQIQPKEKKRVCSCGLKMSWIEAMNSPTGCPHRQAMEEQLHHPTQDTGEPGVHSAACPNLPTAQETFSRAEEVVGAMVHLKEQKVTKKEEVEDLEARLKREEERNGKLEKDLVKEKTSAAKLQEDLTKEKTSAAKLQEDLTKEKASAAKLQEDLTKEKASAAKLQEDLTKEKASAAKLQEDLTKEKASAARYKDFFRKTHLECHNLSRNLHGSDETEQAVQCDNRQPEGASAPPASVSIDLHPTMPEGEGADTKITMAMVDAPGGSLAVSDGVEKEVGPLPAILKGVDIKKEGAD